MAPMINNEALHRVVSIPAVASFIQRFQMNSIMCNGSFVLYSLPYIINFRDALIENHLEIYLVDLNRNLMADGHGVLAESLSRGFQSAELLNRERQNFSQTELSLFLSDQVNKLADLYAIVESINLLFPEISSHGLDSVIKSTQPLGWSMRDRYAACGLVWTDPSRPM